jgi:hypothetical protein
VNSIRFDETRRDQGDIPTMSDGPYLTPTEDEAATLRPHLDGWDALDPWPRSVSIAILRGRRTVDELADALGVTARQPERALRPLRARGPLHDGASGRFLLR